MSTATRVIEQIRVIVAGRSIAPDWMTEPVRVEVGSAAHEWLSSAAGWTSAHRGRLLPGLYGLQVDAPEGIDARCWRVLDRAGAVMVEGEITGP